jgi:hypothetical protein
MRTFPRFLPAAIALLAAAAPAFSQQPATATPSAPAFRNSATEIAWPALRYFSLEHRSVEQVDPADLAILHDRAHELIDEATFHGYDLSTGSWTWNQTICPQLPDSILLHYSSHQAGGAESRFTALVPRHEGRIRVVPVYYHSVTPFHPAVKSSRNFAIFNAAVPPDIALKSTDPQGDWLSLAACYVEMVGGEPNIPNDPSLVPETLLAPQPQIDVAAVQQTRLIRFTDRDAENQYLVWTLSLNRKGQVISADSQTYPSYAAKISNPPVPQPATLTHVPEPPSTVVHPAPVPH